MVVLDSLYLTALWEGTARPLKKLNLLNYEVAVGGVCHNSHWTLIVIYIKEHRAVFLDPFGARQDQIKHCQDITRGLLRRYIPALPRWSCTTLPHPRQRDGSSCGVFICKLAERILSGELPHYRVDPEGVAALRKEILTTLLQATDNLKNRCHVCGINWENVSLDEDEEGDIHWIQCDGCDKWFHSTCVGNPPVDVDYYCFLCLSLPPPN
ncbi:uncharacterized protein LOC129408402 isoform X2 [Boleophthalmus pectinirostris]|nr:uncharacterized protein LOC129408402 isoform X2 [Boleophthalmus pectinirostris]